MKLQDATVIDLERVICRVADLGDARRARLHHRRAATGRCADCVVRVGEEVCGYVNRCPHAGHPLDLLPHRFLTADGTLHPVLLARRAL